MANIKLDDKNALKDCITTINNNDYYECKIFAELTERSEQAIRLLVSKGNRIRKLKAIKVGSSIFIEKDELINFQFAQPGRNKIVSVFDEEGNKQIKIIN